MAGAARTVGHHGAHVHIPVMGLHATTLGLLLLKNFNVILRTFNFDEFEWRCIRLWIETSEGHQEQLASIDNFSLGMAVHFNNKGILLIFDAPTCTHQYK
jgi:hypothetical protein